MLSDSYMHKRVCNHNFVSRSREDYHNLCPNPFMHDPKAAGVTKDHWLVAYIYQVWTLA